MLQNYELRIYNDTLKNRMFVNEILKTLGLSANDTQGIIDVSKGLSLNDSIITRNRRFVGR